METYLDRLDADAEDPTARFERLMGWSLTAGERTEAPLRLGTGQSPRTRAVARWIAAAAVVVMAYGVAAAVFASTRPPRALVADLAAVTPSPSPADRGAERLAARLALVRRARVSAAPLFPRYDPAGLDRAATALADEAGTAPPGSWASQEARLALARVHLYRQRDVEAARVLGGLVREGGYRAPVARRLLDWVRTQDSDPAKTG